MCTCLIEHFHPSRSYTLSIKLYHEKEFHASIYQIYSSSNTWFPHRLSKIYNSIVPLKTLIEDDLSVGRVECYNIIPQRQYYITFIISSILTVIISYALIRYKKNHPSPPSTKGNTIISKTTTTSTASRCNRTPPKSSTTSSTSYFNRVNSTTKPKTTTSYINDYNTTGTYARPTSTNTSSTSSSNYSKYSKPNPTTSAGFTFRKPNFGSSSSGTGAQRLNSRFASGSTPNQSFADEY